MCACTHVDTRSTAQPASPSTDAPHGTRARTQRVSEMTKPVSTLYHRVPNTGQQVRCMMTNTSIFSSFGGGGTTGAKRGAENSHGGTLPDTALIMDECDGMSSGDRGGLQAPLIALSIPSTCVFAGGCVHVCSSGLRK